LWRKASTATSTEAVLARAGVSKGALYHHFASKAELLAAVFEAVSRETVARAQSAAGGAGSARAELTAALKAWLRAVLAPEPRRIILETGPAVLGLRSRPGGSKKRSRKGPSAAASSARWRKEKRNARMSTLSLVCSALRFPSWR
jgi:AcrR family transcriptional regulator